MAVLAHDDAGAGHCVVVVGVGGRGARREDDDGGEHAEHEYQEHGQDGGAFGHERTPSRYDALPWCLDDHLEPRVTQPS